MRKKGDIESLKKNILEEKKIVKQIVSLSRNLERTRSGSEKRMITSHINSLKNNLKKSNDQVEEDLAGFSIAKPLEKTGVLDEGEAKTKRGLFKKSSATGLEKETIKRLVETEKEGKEVKKKVKKQGLYVKAASKIFSRSSKNLVKGEGFNSLKRNLIKANLQFLPVGYVSVMLLTTLVSFIVAVLGVVFFLFFNVTPGFSPVTRTAEDLMTRFLKTFWLLFIFPMGTFLFMYFYPSMEKKSSERKINAEMPFVTIHMAAISGSMVDPSKIFDIILTTKEYPNVSKEFRKLINEINIHGYDLVSALRRASFNSPSRKLAELFNGLATTITSGGNLPEFFEKRSQSLLFEHRIESEKQTRSAETFMDIYISVVIAAPMIFMLLLMMMKISGLGISLSTSMITILMVSGVAVVNVVFLVFLQLKQPVE